jgi:hypothetical protein
MARRKLVPVTRTFYHAGRAALLADRRLAYSRHVEGVVPAVGDATPAEAERRLEESITPPPNHLFVA